MNKKLSMSKEDYLEAIYILEKSEDSIRSVRVAEMLGVSKPAVNRAMNELGQDGFIIKSNYAAITLTEEGRKEAKKILHRHSVIRDFLLKIGVSEKTAENDCCRIEHMISEETLRQLEKFIQ